MNIRVFIITSQSPCLFILSAVSSQEWFLLPDCSLDTASHFPVSSHFQFLVVVLFCFVCFIGVLFVCFTRQFQVLLYVREILNWWRREVLQTYYDVETSSSNREYSLFHQFSYNIVSFVKIVSGNHCGVQVIGELEEL